MNAESSCWVLLFTQMPKWHYIHLFIHSFLYLSETMKDFWRSSKKAKHTLPLLCFLFFFSAPGNLVCINHEKNCGRTLPLMNEDFRGPITGQGVVRASGFERGRWEAGEKYFPLDWRDDRDKVEVGEDPSSDGRFAGFCSRRIYILEWLIN